MASPRIFGWNRWTAGGAGWRVMVACGLVAGSAVTGLAATPPGQAASDPPDTVEFHFSPPDGSAWVKDFQDVRHSPDPQGPGGQREQKTTLRIDLLFQKDPAGGWVVTQTPFEGEITFNGEGTTNPALAQNLNHTLKVHINDAGRAERIDGFRELERKFERNLPPEQFAKLAKTYTAQNMERMELAQWNKPLADLIGARVTTGERWQMAEAVVVGSAQLYTTGVMSFDGWTELRGRRGYKVTYEYDTTEAAIAKAGGGFTRTVNRIAADQQATRSNIVLTGSVVRVIEPQTGLVLYEHAQRSYDIPTDSPDGPPAHYDEEQIVRLDPGDRAN